MRTSEAQPAGASQRGKTEMVWTWTVSLSGRMLMLEPAGRRSGRRAKRRFMGWVMGFFGHNNNSVPMYFIHQATSCHCDTRPIADLWTVELAILR